jgi:D-sedoheptulose 7-phosphate isomerase
MSAAIRSAIATPTGDAGTTTSREILLHDTIRDRIESSVSVKSALARDLGVMVQVAGVLVDAFQAGRKLVLFGNGGSAADAQHIAAEFVGMFYIRRRPLSAIALTVNTSVLTAIGNDFGFDDVFQRQVEAVGEPGDVAIGISTSGRAENVLRGLRAASAAGMITVGLTGRTGGRLAGEVDYLATVPSDDTPRIQEAHITLGHIWSEIVEEALFGPPGA